MSTKIYNAFRLKPRHDMWTVTADIRAKVEKRCRFILTKVYGDITSNAKDYGYTGKRDMFSVSRWVLEQYKAQAFKYDRNAWDLDVHIAVHNVDGRILLRAFHGSGWFSSTIKVVERHRSLEDYHYQNSSDRPDNITARAWNERRRTWERAMRPDGNFIHQLVVEIVSPSSWHRIDPALDIIRRESLEARRKANAK